MKQIFTAFLMISCIIRGYCQEGMTDSAGISSKIYQLGEVVISGVAEREGVGEKEIRMINSQDVATAMDILPSVIFTSGGARNESTIFLRGFDIRSVPVFMDGIPVYVPYDGYMDLARLTTAGLSRIDVSKGFSSMMYGPNTIGGAINLVSRKPEQRLELSARAGITGGNGYDMRLNAGGNNGKMYVQGNFSMLGQKFMPLPAKFKTSVLETDHRRDNSDWKDMKSNLKAGYTPNKTDEYSLNYIYSHGSKGNPVYLGNDPKTPVRYWNWPYWDKQSLYFISRTSVGQESWLKTRFYYDRFGNELRSFNDAGYSVQTRGYAFNSFYDDYTLGSIVEYSGAAGSANLLRVSGHLKNDNHAEHNSGEPVRHFADNTFSLALEDVCLAGSRLTLVPGFSYNVRKSLRADNFDPETGEITGHPGNSNDAFNAQLGTYYRFSKSVSTHFNVSWKSRFATMKDRYSYRLSVALPNPDLKSEGALNLELAAAVLLNGNLSIRPGLFYSRLVNTIQMVSYVRDDLSQMQNTGRSEFAGTDLSLTWKPVENSRLYMVYSFINRRNLSNPRILFTDVPDHKVYASAEYIFAKRLTIDLSWEYLSGRINSSDGSLKSAAFALANAGISCHITGFLDAEAGAGNLFDRYYTLQEGYPESGRSLYFTLNYHFQK